MKYSISNLAWGDTPLDIVVPKLANAGLNGVEIALTAIWPDLDNLHDKEVIEFKKYLEEHKLAVSGIQSLLYGHPELQLFDQNCWGDLRNHLENVIRIGGILEADVAVFGSPKNRLKKSLNINQADDLAEIFLRQLDPCLKENDIVLTLEPNAPQYGADYLTTYEEVVQLTKRINSGNIKPQVDTGCIWMIEQDPARAFNSFLPHHIHVSVPNLLEVPGNFTFSTFFEALKLSDYVGWLTVESMGNSIEQAIKSVNWLKSELEGDYVTI